MFRLWGKIIKDNKIIRDMVVENGDPGLRRTQKIFAAIDDICRAFDLSKPIWLDANIAEFKRHDKTRFRQDNFIEIIDFDFLEIQVIEED